MLIVASLVGIAGASDARDIPEAERVASRIGPASAPTPGAACGSVDVDDRSDAPSAGRAMMVRDTMREELSALGACSSAYRMRGNLMFEVVSETRARVRLNLVVYTSKGSLAAEIPASVSGNRASSDDLEAADTLLRTAAQQAAHVFSENFR